MELFYVGLILAVVGGVAIVVKANQKEMAQYRPVEDGKAKAPANAQAGDDDHSYDFFSDYVNNPLYFHMPQNIYYHDPFKED